MPKHERARRIAGDAGGIVASAGAVLLALTFPVICPQQPCLFAKDTDADELHRPRANIVSTQSGSMTTPENLKYRLKQTRHRSDLRVLLPASSLRWRLSCGVAGATRMLCAWISSSGPPGRAAEPSVGIGLA